MTVSTSPKRNSIFPTRCSLTSFKGENHEKKPAGQSNLSLYRRFIFGRSCFWDGFAEESAAPARLPSQFFGGLCRELLAHLFDLAFGIFPDGSVVHVRPDLFSRFSLWGAHGPANFFQPPALIFPPAFGNRIVFAGFFSCFLFFFGAFDALFSQFVFLSKLQSEILLEHYDNCDDIYRNL
jgi:hypothetical protein